MQITEGKVEAYRAKVKVSFKYEGEQWLCSGCKLCPTVECHLGMSIDAALRRDVCFTPESGHWTDIPGGPFCADIVAKLES